MFHLEDFVALVSAESPSWIASGATWSLERSPADGRNKHSAWVTIRQADREGVLIVWDSGEGELEFGGSTEPLIQKHFDGLEAAVAPLAELVAFVIRG